MTELTSKRKQDDIDDTKQETKKTKRQHIKELKHSKKNKWVSSHPHMKSMEKRENAYLFDANIHPKQSKKIETDKQQMLNPEVEFDSPELKFGRFLGSSCEKTRHKSVAALQNYLRERCNSKTTHGGFTELEMLKCWKGLWYCLVSNDTH